MAPGSILKQLRYIEEYFGSFRDQQINVRNCATHMRSGRTLCVLLWNSYKLRTAAICYGL